MGKNAYTFQPGRAKQSSMLNAATKSSGIWRWSKPRAINKPCDQLIVTCNTFSWSCTRVELINKEGRELCLPQKACRKDLCFNTFACLPYGAKNQSRIEVSNVAHAVFTANDEWKTNSKQTGVQSVSASALVHLKHKPEGDLIGRMKWERMLGATDVSAANSTPNIWNGGDATRITKYWSDEEEELECIVHLNQFWADWASTLAFFLKLQVCNLC